APYAPCLKSSIPSASANSARNRPNRADRRTRLSRRSRSCPLRQRRISGFLPASVSAIPCGRDELGRKSARVSYAAPSDQGARRVVEQLVDGEFARNELLLRDIVRDGLQRAAHLVRGEMRRARRRGGLAEQSVHLARI